MVLRIVGVSLHLTATKSGVALVKDRILDSGGWPGWSMKALNDQVIAQMTCQHQSL